MATTEVPDTTALLHDNRIAAVPDADWWTKLGKYMPTGTFFVFQAVAPFITNNGNCGAGLEWHKIVTGVVLLVLAAVCMFLAFTDSIVVDNTLYYGVATSSGMRILYPKRIPLPPELGDTYKIRPGDWAHAIMSALVFLGLSVITPPVSTCFSVTVKFLDPSAYTGLATLVGAVASSATFLGIKSGPPRHGLGFASFVPPPDQT